MGLQLEKTTTRKVKVVKKRVEKQKPRKRLEPVNRGHPILRGLAFVLDISFCLLYILYFHKDLNWQALYEAKTYDLLLPVYIILILIPEVFFGYSIGKFLFGLRVVNHNDAPAFKSRMVLRSSIFRFSMLTLLPVLLMFGLNKAYYDKLLNLYVIKDR